MKILSLTSLFLTFSATAAFAGAKPCTVNLTQNEFPGINVNQSAIQSEVAKDLQKIGCTLVMDNTAKYELQVNIDGMYIDDAPKPSISDYPSVALLYLSEIDDVNGGAVAEYRVLDGANLNSSPIAWHTRTFAYSTETPTGGEKAILSNAMWAAKTGVKQIKIAEENEAVK